MDIAILKEALAKFDDLLDFQLTWFQLEDDLSIRVSDYFENDWETPEETEIEQFSFYAKFMGREYSFDLTKKRLIENESSFCSIEGDEILFSSFVNIIEDNEEVWEQLKLLCFKVEALIKADNLE